MFGKPQKALDNIVGSPEWRAKQEQESQQKLVSQINELADLFLESLDNRDEVMRQANWTVLREKLTDSTIQLVAGMCQVIETRLKQTVDKEVKSYFNTSVATKSIKDLYVR